MPAVHPCGIQRSDQRLPAPDSGSVAVGSWPLLPRLVRHVRPPSGAALLRGPRFAYHRPSSYEVTFSADHLRKKNIVKELGLAGMASFFLGFGTLFVLLWTGVYV